MCVHIFHFFVCKEYWQMQKLEELGIKVGTPGYYRRQDYTTAAPRGLNGITVKVKSCVKRPLKKKTNKDLFDKW